MRPRVERTSLAVLLILGLLGSMAHGSALLSPQINSLSESTLERSGLLYVHGVGFGPSDPASQLLIDGVPAMTTSWTDTEIHGYVPETAGLTLVTVQVVTAAGSSNADSLTVTTRIPGGRFRWRFKMDSNYAGMYLGVGADGTVYATDNLRMYALDPDGGLKWISSDGGGGRPVVFGADGTIYTGEVAALNTDGSTKWLFRSASRGIAVAGPGVGPDGNVYAVEESYNNGLGVFSLDPNGNLLWSTDDNPYINAIGTNSEVLFGDPTKEQLYFGYYKSKSGPYPGLYCFDFRGNEVWRYAGGCQITFATMGPAHQLSFAGQFGCGVTTLDEDMNQQWNSAPPSAFSGAIVQQVVGPDGGIFTGDFYGDALWAVNADGSTRWFRQGGVGLANHLGVSPDNTTLLDCGSSGIYGDSGWVRGYSASDGSLLWQADYPSDEWNTGMITYSNHPEFASDSKTAYLTTAFPYGPGYSYVYAVDTCNDVASWANYDQGWSGTQGIPELKPRSNPVLGSPITVDLDNSLGSQTQGWLYVGSQKTSLPTNVDGTLLVVPTLVFPLAIPGGGLALTGTLPSDPTLCGMSWYLQALELDAGASKGVSFTQGLHLQLGSQ